MTGNYAVRRIIITPHCLLSIQGQLHVGTFIKSRLVALHIINASTFLSQVQ